ncbi:MAG: class I SAM-dependent methyltransferase [Acidobacteriaceae bacterium]
MENFKKLGWQLKNSGIKKTLLKLCLKLIRYRASPQMKNFKSIEKYFKGKTGLEIGGPSDFFAEDGCIPIYPIVSSLDGVNFSATTVWTGNIDLPNGYVARGKSLGKQFILDATDLSELDKQTYDFVLSCNNIEHIANPLKAVEQWVSLLKPNGVIVIVAPKKEANFDHNRSTVKFTHLIQNYKDCVQEDDLEHLEEILKLHDLTLDPPAGTPEQFKERSLKNFENRCLHHHVFSLQVLSEVCLYFKLSVIGKLEIHGNYVIIARNCVDSSGHRRVGEAVAENGDSASIH